jgi:hypothetical protein
MNLRFRISGIILIVKASCTLHFSCDYVEALGKTENRTARLQTEI